MFVPYNYLPYEFKNPSKILKEWKKLIKTSEFTLGTYVNKFEKTFSKYIGAKYCISTNNGTDALILCLKSLGIGKGDEVITATNSFYATAGAIYAVGAKPILCDVDSRYQIETKKIKSLINKRTKAIMPVHWAGASPEMNKILTIAKKYNLYIIEDACMGIGAKISKKSPGTFGNVNAFSMHPLKSLNVMGDGGAVVTNNKNIFNWLKKYRNHGMINRDKISFWGVNNRIQPLQAVVALEGLKKLDYNLKKRKLNADYLDKNLREISEFVKIPKRLKHHKETYALYMILCKNRNKLKKYLEKNNIETKIHYPVPLHKQKPYRNNSKKILNLKNSENQAKHLLTLPVHQFLSKAQLDYMVKKIKYFYLKNDS